MICPPILSYCSQQHGVVMVHCSRLAARICGIRMDKQIINLQELLFWEIGTPKVVNRASNALNKIGYESITKADKSQ